MTYADGYVPVACWDVDWLMAFFLFSLGVALVFKHRFKVTF